MWENTSTARSSLCRLDSGLSSDYIDSVRISMIENKIESDKRYENAQVEQINSNSYDT